MKNLIIIYLLTAGTHLFADSIATVLFSKNKVIALKNGAEFALSRGSALDVGDTIITSNDAVANIKYANGTLVNLASNTNYKILAFSPKNSNEQIKAQLNKGTLSSKTPGKMNETLKTPVIALSIIGTDYAVYVEDTKNKLCQNKLSKTTLCKRTYLKVNEGHVRMGGTTFGAGSSVVATPSGIKNAAFPVPVPSSAPIISGPGSEASTASSSVTYVSTLTSNASTTSATIATSIPLGLSVIGCN